MKVIDFLEMLFPRNNDAHSGQQAKERLQAVLAHDRAAITPEIIDSMRREILEVVACYVDVDRDEIEFGLENSQRITSLIAHFPIRKVKRTTQEQINSLEQRKRNQENNDELLDL